MAEHGVVFAQPGEVRIFGSNNNFQRQSETDKFLN
jgi:hypothetical protein